MNSEDPVVCVVPGDLHLTEPNRDNHRLALWMTDEVNHLIRPDFVQFIGDNVQDATEAQFHLFNELAGRLRVPWYALVGDHDVKDDPGASRFRKLVGDPTGALSLRGFHFIRLNTQESKPVGLSPEQLAWFRDEVDAATESGKRVLVFQHNYPYQIWEDFAGPGIDGWRELVQTRRITAVFTGHTHYFQIANDGRNVVVATRSIGDPEGGQPGYLIIFLHGDDLAVTYRSREDHQPTIMITHPRQKLLATSPAHVVRGPDEIRVRAWSSSTIAEVNSRVDDGPWQPLRQSGPLDWVCPLEGEKLSKGEHFLEVRATDQAGWVGVQTIEFATDQTGRYTAVPGVWPMVTSTNFC